MKLRELKCKNCGAKLKVDENASMVDCKYCHTSFAVEDAFQEGYKFEKGRMKAHSEHMEKHLENAKELIEPVGKAFLFHSAITAIIGIVIFLVVVTFIIVIAVKQVKGNDVSDFNNTLEMYNGTKSGHSVNNLIDEVSLSNKKEEKHKITIIYKDIETQDPEVMKDIKKQLDGWTKYEVSLEYDADGFIYQITIEE